MSQVSPRVRVLTVDQIEQVHTQACRVLAEVGVRVDCPRARRLLTDGPVRDSDPTRVRIAPATVQWALSRVPPVLTVHDRNARPAFQIGGGQPTRFGIGVTNLYYQTPADDRIEPFSRRHAALAAALGNTLAEFDVVSTPGILQDLPSATADLTATLELTANTTKPIVLLVSEEGLFETVLDMLEALYGDLAARPWVMPYVNPITPLVLNAGTTGHMVAAIERGLPLIFSNFGMMGASTPITPAGTLALMTAELLAGLVFSQRVRPGAAVVLGSLPNGFYMDALAGDYTPTSLLINLAGAEMMAHYGIPHVGASGSGAGWAADLPAADALWLTHLPGCLGRVGLAPFVGGNHASLVFSPTMIVHAHEVIRQARRFSRGFVIAPEEFALEEIAAVGPGGDFLASDLTFARFRQEHWRSGVWPRMGLDAWQAAGCPPADRLLRERTQALLREPVVPADRGALIERGEAFIARSMAT